MAESEASFSGNANDLTDYVLKKFPKKSIDPLPINVNTEAIKIQEGELRGLSNVSRYGNCTLHSGDNETKIILELAASNLSSYFKYQIQTGLLTIKGELSTVANQVVIRVDITLVDGKINLNSFQVMKLEGFRFVKFTGVTRVFSWLLKIIANGILHSLKGHLIRKLEKDGKEIIQQIINQMPLSKL